MKRTVLLGIIALFICQIVVSQEKECIGTVYNLSELDSTEQMSIEKNIKEYFELIENKDLERFWNNCHPIFKESTPKDKFLMIGMYLNNVIPEYNNLSLINAKLFEFNKPPLNENYTLNGNINKLDRDYLEYHAIDNIQKQLILIYKTNNFPVEKHITMILGLENKNYKLIGLDIHACSFQEKDAYYYGKLAFKWKLENSKFASYIASSFSNYLSLLNPRVSNMDHLISSQQLQQLKNDSILMHNLQNWKIGNSEYQIVDWSWSETQNDITPTIIYITQKSLTKESIENEAGILFDYLNKKYPELTNEFKLILFKAFEEYPDYSQPKTYRYYTVKKENLK